MKLPNSIFVDGRIATLNKLIEQPLEISEAYKLLKLAREIKDKEANYTSARLKIFEKYGKQNKEGQWEIKNKKGIEKATEEMNKLLALEEEYDLKGRVKVPGDVRLSANEIALLEEIIELPE